MMRRITKPIICILVTLLPFFRGYTQDGLDMVNWYILKVAEVDKNALLHHIQTVSLSVRDTGEEKAVVKKLYDKKGYLVSRVDYSGKNKLDSVETVIKRISSSETVIEYKFTGGDYYVDDEDDPVPDLLGYLDTLHADNYSVLIKKYTKVSDSTVRVITSLNNSVEKSTEFILLNNAKQQPVIASGDTACAHDTLVLIKQQKDALGKLSVLKTYFIKGIVTPVKEEALRYWHDSLAYQQVEINEFDKKKRLVNHAVYQGPPLTQYESKRIIYNDLTGERTETEDNHPTTGTPQRIWRYDKKGRIVYFERVALYGRDKGSMVYKYNKKGLLEEAVFSVNDVPSRYTLYKYRYY
ncbi:hypothetical protein A3860_24270 [Niastella vici]|uniref:Uncharacterized protein n=1 Tax=Niastella vici TaxID=1703345 RepID=A0A1V9FYP9_9BACT|nr:hypothetical protein [Niastella vici]OQP63462.1 hypothetical protein A3860_24270 [Niastella vici]